MKIAQIAPLMESVPPLLYGGSERVVSYLTEELLGHQVSLFATEDLVTSAELVPCGTRAIRLDGTGRDVVPYYMLMLDKVRPRAAEFDVLHFHIDHFHFPLFREIASRTVTTLHGRQDHRDRLPFFAGFREMPLVSISDAQRAPVSHVNFVATVHNGLPLDLLRPNYRPRGGYLAFLGRISACEESCRRYGHVLVSLTDPYRTRPHPHERFHAVLTARRLASRTGRRTS